VGDPVLLVKVLPRCSLNQIVGFEGNILKVKVKSAPVDGLANRDLIQLLSKFLKIAKGKIEIISGHKSKLKKVQFYGMKKDDLFILLNK
jgi:uncharacterized protein